MISYRFPIYLLGMPVKPLDCLKCYRSWCLVTEGRKILEKNPNAASIYESAEISLVGAPAKFDEASPEARQIVLGQRVLGEEGGSVSEHMERFNRANDHVASMTRRFGTPPFVSIGRDLVWDQMSILQGYKCPDVSWRRFTVLCAVNCACGNKEVPSVFTRNFLRALALGLKSPKGMFEEDNRISEKGANYQGEANRGFPTTQDLRRDLDKLEQQGLIGRLIVTNRSTAFYLPHQCSRKEALEWLKARCFRVRRTTADLRAEERVLIQTTRLARVSPPECSPPLAGLESAAG